MDRVRGWAVGTVSHQQGWQSWQSWQSEFAPSLNASGRCPLARKPEFFMQPKREQDFEMGKRKSLSVHELGHTHYGMSQGEMAPHPAWSPHGLQAWAG